MTIAQQVRELHENATQRANAAGFLKLARLVCQHGNIHAAMASPEGQRASDPVQRYMKAAIAPMGTSNAAALVALTPMSEAFASTLVGSGSVFDTVKAGARVVPANTRIAIVSGGVTASSVAEFSAKPLSSLTLTAADMQTTKVIAHVTIANELTKFSTPEAVTLFNDELRAAVIRQTDAEFLAQLAAATTPTASAGGTAVNILADVNAMVALVDVQPASQLYWVMNVAQALAYSQVFTTGGLLFPQLGPLGGPALSGIQILTSNETPANRSLLIVADGLAIVDEPIEPRQSTQGTVYMNTAPDSPPIASSVVTSLWQSNLTALLLERGIAVRPRARSVASISY